MTKNLRLLLIGGLLTNCAFAQKLTLPVETAHNALVLQVSNNNDLTQVYFGEKLNNPSEYKAISLGDNNDYSGVYRSAYTSSGSRNLLEPAISIQHADGNQSLDLRYVSYKQEKLSADIFLTSVKLKDPVYNVEVTLFYKAYIKDDVIEQWSVINHREKGDIILQKYASADLNLSAKSYWLRQYHGEWAKEMRPEETQITHGIKTLDSKLGTRANLFMPSVFMVSLDRTSTEDEGSVLMAALEWSGNFRTDLELDPEDHLRIISGINNYASAYRLKPGIDFVTPAFVYTYSTHGKGDASRHLHNWTRDYKIMDGKGDRLTLLNNWESTYFDFNEQKLFNILKDTKELGVDLFLLDDGWFGNKYPRDDDRAGLGDWQENHNKLPNGIASIAREADKDGVKFGIWIEPEMVNPKSILYNKHPDWVIKQPKRDEYYFRNQLVLDLSNPAVQDFVFGVVDSLFIKDPKLAYIKWDCNSVIFNAYSAHLKHNQSQLYVDYVRGLYKVLQRVRQKYPNIPMMLCSGGGGRVDYAALQYFTEFWPSDNTDPLERIFIQWEYSYFYPAITSSNHVTDWGRQPLKYRVDVAMMGKLGFDIVISKLNPRDLQFCKDAVNTYNTIKPIIWHGDQYRLSDPQIDNVASVMYVDNLKNSTVMFNYLVNNRFDAGSKAPILLKGLDPARKYTVKEINLYPGAKSNLNFEAVYTGDFLMKIGINPNVDARRSSVVIQIEQAQ
ncbi:MULTISPECIES: alpha-galactosidase [unclassified Mucilaginibacter]|uniref:alpha-galactosidase n=1 Tax=unclassified Mucilaginibacter TaxID=2617802 RepID=UPI000B27BEDA|nr:MULTISPECIES: alpha-galactosidase [unclassified Mucilaginibacter]PLW89724.1 MAG: alpha-galactosidase [Mucilaginibacter sp.]PMP65999.1 MAG: alpha-galactosidase [Mucilaginibacter sp.]HEK22348.1 alpha-galactosidase [Bacteroidota bacterium]